MNWTRERRTRGDCQPNVDRLGPHWKQRASVGSAERVIRQFCTELMAHPLGSCAALMLNPDNMQQIHNSVRETAHNGASMHNRELSGFTPGDSSLAIRGSRSRSARFSPCGDWPGGPPHLMRRLAGLADVDCRSRGRIFSGVPEPNSRFPRVFRCSDVFH